MLLAMRHHHHHHTRISSRRKSNKTSGPLWVTYDAYACSFQEKGTIHRQWNDLTRRQAIAQTPRWSMPMLRLQVTRQ